MHVCCGPCFLVPYDALIKDGWSITAIYYNPNIHPFSEYERRLNVARDYCLDQGIDFIEEPYAAEDYFRAAASENCFNTGAIPSAPIVREGVAPVYYKRCRRCFRLRLGRTVVTAKARGFSAFSTSLLVSPYQLHEELKSVAETLASENGVDFIYRDFRPFYRDSVVMSKRLGMYRQNYCGCVFSEQERLLERGRKKRVVYESGINR